MTPPPMRVHRSRVKWRVSLFLKSGFSFDRWASPSAKVYFSLSDSCSELPKIVDDADLQGLAKSCTSDSKLHDTGARRPRLGSTNQEIEWEIKMWKNMAQIRANGRKMNAKRAMLLGLSNSQSVNLPKNWDPKSNCRHKSLVSLFDLFSDRFYQFL